MKIVVGLGNPGEKYQNNRHNVGFLALNYIENYLVRNIGISITWKNEQKFDAAIAKVKCNSSDIIFVRPLTMMNLSGRAVDLIMKFYKVNPENLVVIYDDIDLPFGDVRMRRSGSAGTHNGMKSIIDFLSTEKFARIRIGIENRPPELRAKIDLAEYVLSNFTNSEMCILDESFKKTLNEVVKSLDLIDDFK